MECAGLTALFLSLRTRTDPAIESGGFAAALQKGLSHERLVERRVVS